jgi:hypothetical protein
LRREQKQNTGDRYEARQTAAEPRKTEEDRMAAAEARQKDEAETLHKYSRSPEERGLRGGRYEAGQETKKKLRKHPKSLSAYI